MKVLRNPESGDFFSLLGIPARKALPFFFFLSIKRGGRARLEMPNKEKEVACSPGLLSSLLPSRPSGAANPSKAVTWWMLNS